MNYFNRIALIVALFTINQIESVSQRPLQTNEQKRFLTFAATVNRLAPFVMHNGQNWCICGFPVAPDTKKVAFAGDKTYSLSVSANGSMIVISDGSPVILFGNAAEKNYAQVAAPSPVLCVEFINNENISASFGGNSWATYSVAELMQTIHATLSAKRHQ